MKKDLVEAIANLEEKKTLHIVKNHIENGVTALEIVEQCKQGVEIVGRKYSEEIYYLSDLIMSEEILNRIMKFLKPHFPKNTKRTGIKVVIGTIEGDIHDLGKNIVINLLRSHGFDIYDLGVDVKPKQFVEALKETGAKILGISVLLTFSIHSVKKVIEKLTEEGLREETSVLLGRYPIDEKIREFTGADYYETDAIKAVELFKKVARPKK
ncbi:cobalamin-dependent protein [bacterium]|nr:cobalamin-dependent protein [bacterium]